VSLNANVPEHSSCWYQRHSFVLPVFALYVQSEPDNKTTNPEPEDTYFGQILPEESAEAFAPDVFVHEAHDSPILSPDERWPLFKAKDVDIAFYGMDGERLFLYSP
jgi:hypothetical protein